MLHDEVRQALSVVIDRLSPAERTSFILHDIFGFPFDAVAGLVGRTPAACRSWPAALACRSGPGAMRSWRWSAWMTVRAGSPTCTPSCARPRPAESRLLSHFWRLSRRRMT